MTIEEARKILDVNIDATKQEIKQSWRTLVKKYHPDRVVGQETKFKLVQEAYNTLTTENAELAKMEEMIFDTMIMDVINSWNHENQNQKKKTKIKSPKKKKHPA